MAKDKPIFDIKSMLNTSSIEQATQRKRRIHYKNLFPHEENHYSLHYIDELADSIQDVGLLQDLVVKPAGAGIYKIIVGHRRHLAIKMLVEERGLAEYEEVVCDVINENEDELLTLLKLHLTNTTTREMTEHDKMMAVSELKDLIIAAKEKGIPIKGKVRDIIAETVNLGATQVQKYLNINEQATDDVKESLKKGEITVQEAYETTRPKKERHPPKQAADESDAEANDIEDETAEPLLGENQVRDVIRKFNAFKKASIEIDNPELDALICKVEERLWVIRRELGL